MNFIQIAKYIIHERGGYLGLYRGIAPGSLRSFIGNGNRVLKYVKNLIKRKSIFKIFLYLHFLRMWNGNNAICSKKSYRIWFKKVK